MYRKHSTDWSGFVITDTDARSGQIYWEIHSVILSIACDEGHKYRILNPEIKTTKLEMVIEQTRMNEATFLCCF